MSKKALFLSFGCFIFGLALGIGGSYVIMLTHYGKRAARILVTAHDIWFMDQAQRTWRAYGVESTQVKIYALSQFLITLEHEKKLSDKPIGRRRTNSIDMIVTHGRLAKLYAETGETRLSAQHVEEAVSCAAEIQYTNITDQVTLAEFVAKMDKLAGYSGSPKSLERTSGSDEHSN